MTNLLVSPKSGVADLPRLDNNLGVLVAAEAASHGLTGVDDVYEAPHDAELTLRPADAPTAVDTLIKELRRRDIVA